MKRPLLASISGTLVMVLLQGCPNSVLSVQEVTAPIQFAQAQSRPVPGTPMTPARLEAILRQEATNLRSEGGQWQFILENRTLLLLVSEERDRMRIIAPILPEADMTPEQRQNVLVANFHTALDARYAVTDGTLVAIYLHRLSSLQENDFRSALYQVARLATTFGSTYSSSELIFGPNGQPQSEPGVRGGQEI